MSSCDLRAAAPRARLPSPPRPHEPHPKQWPAMPPHYWGQIFPIPAAFLSSTLRIWNSRSFAQKGFVVTLPLLVSRKSSSGEGPEPLMVLWLLCASSPVQELGLTGHSCGWMGREVERVERMDAHLPGSGLMLESAKDGLRPPGTRGQRDRGFPPCWKINLLFLPQEEDGINTDKMQPQQTKFQLCISRLSQPSTPRVPTKPSLPTAPKQESSGLGVPAHPSLLTPGCAGTEIPGSPASLCLPSSCQPGLIP